MRKSGEKVNISISQSAEGQVSRQMAYTKEFKDFVRNHPGIISIVKQLIAEVTPENVQYHDIMFDKEKRNEILGKMAEKDGVKVEMLGIGPVSKHYMVETEDGNFFVKIRPNRKIYGAYQDQSGFTEFMSSAQAEKRLQGTGIKVVNYEFGYKSDSNDVFVSKPINIKKDFQVSKLTEPGQYIRASLLSSRVKGHLHKRLINIVRTKLGIEYGADFYLKDIFYNPKTKTILLFDINSFVMQRRYRRDIKEDWSESDINSMRSHATGHGFTEYTNNEMVVRHKAKIPQDYIDFERKDLDVEQ